MAIIFSARYVIGEYREHKEQEYGNINHYDLSIEQVKELIRKYDLKELYGVEYQIDDDVMLKSYDEQ